ncbi:MAG: colanic acid biosynthesis glycosyltransferase WcaL, partial [Acaryochloridaceae cyanobacterium SU_2_1]|nr:colanic acid biosynthesis glycosyltransferase WcaL [Acaryochloridaceae cyanobacterium SU_2_1]
KITVHHMGIDCQAFPFIPRQLVNQEPVRIVTVARLVEKKGIEYGIRAIAILKQEQPNIQYEILGDGYLRESLQTLIAQLQLDDTVHLLGWKQQAEVIDILNKAHILLAPSVTGQKGDQEGIPVALMEAMAMGLPVVSTQYTGIPELIEDGVSGFLVPERDCDAIAHKLKKLIDHSQQWQQMGQAGRDYVEAHYNIHPLTKQLMELYCPA